MSELHLFRGMQLEAELSHRKNTAEVILISSKKGLDQLFISLWIWILHYQMFFKFYFIFKLYITVLVLPNIKFFFKWHLYFSLSKSKTKKIHKNLLKNLNSKISLLKLYTILCIFLCISRMQKYHIRELLTERKMHNIKVLFGDLIKDCSLGDSLRGTAPKR